MPDIIRLKGSKDGETVEFNPSKHVKLSDGFYDKLDHENVVNINGRFYRKNSPLICELAPFYYGQGSFALVEECVDDVIQSGKIYACDSSSVSPGSRVVKLDNSIVELKKGERVHYKTSSIVIRIKSSRTEGYLDCTLYGDYHSAIRAGIIYNIPRSSFVVMAEDVIDMHESYGGRKCTYLGTIHPSNSSYLTSFKQMVESGYIVEAGGGYHYGSDVSWSSDNNGNKYRPIRNERTRFVIDQRPNPFSISKGLCSRMRQAITILSASSKPQMSTINELLRSNWFESTNLDADFSSESYMTKWGVFVGVKGDAKLLDSLHDIVSSMCENEKSKTRSKLDTITWFKGFNREPLPPMYSRNTVGNQGGDYVYNLNKSRQIDDNYSSTGGIGYTFGVEIETELGVVPLEVAKVLPVDCVGDRSIGGLEYVTGPLSGKRGIDTLMWIADEVSKYTMVADTCGIHVHVGSDGGKWSPRFDKEFGLLSVMLGCLIEDELFSLLPLNRREKKNSSGQSYCSSIKDYTGINKTNWSKNLFHYVYGRNPEDPSEGFGELDSLVERRHQVGRWGVGRYKWLNLVNCLTDNSGRRNGGGFQTIEFRAFNGTLNKEDLRAFVLISLAFVTFIEQNRAYVYSLKSIKLLDIIESTMDRKTITWFSEWIEGKKSQIRMVSLIKSEPEVENNSI